MSNKIEIINEQFGNFMMASTLPPPPTYTTSSTPINNSPSLNEIMQSNQQYAIDNALLYKKLIDIENELKSLKNIINSLQYPRPTYYPVQSFAPMTSQPNIMNPPNHYTNF